MSVEKAKYCNCLYYSANALARVITRIADEEFSITGLSPSYAFLIMSINKNPGIQPTELAMIMQLKPSTVTRLIEKLENKNLIERKSEGKYTLVFPTQKAIEMDDTIKSAWMNLYKRYVSILGEDNAIELTNSIYLAFEKLDK